MAVTLRLATESDLLVVQRTLFLAITWNGVPPGATFERAMEHDELVMYYEDWGRDGDIGVIAELDAEVVGSSFGRLFSSERHGHGFVDEDTPELAIAVEPGNTGNGIGTALMRELEEQYCVSGTRQLSLSVDVRNPAMGLYQRLGYSEVARDEGSARMLKQL